MMRNRAPIRVTLGFVLLAGWAVAMARNTPGTARTPQSATTNATTDTWLAGIPKGTTRVVDLAYAINDKMPSWPGHGGVQFEATVLTTQEKDGNFTRRFTIHEHYGTHIDAPAHFPPGKLTVDQIPVKQFFGPAVVIDARAEVAKNDDYQLPASSVEAWEAAHGRIPAGAIVLLNTGWAARWPDEARYRNKDAKGVMHFPGFSSDAAKLLVERGVSGVGIDTFAPDYGPSEDHAVHQILLGASRYILENLSDLSGLPPAGAFLIAAPIKLEGGSGGPVRVFVILPQ
jgi:kynurenine formamidase